MEDVILTSKSFKYCSASQINMGATVAIRKDAIADLIKVKENFDAIVESLELMSDKDFMKSYHKSRRQISKREFADWNEL